MELEAFVRTNADSPARWRYFLDRRPVAAPRKRDFPDKLVPFHGLNVFAGLSAEKRRHLGEMFVQLNAESFIFLELLLHQGFPHLKGTPLVRDAADKVVAEEALHTKAFLAYLHDVVPEFPKRSFILRRNRGPKNFMLWIARHFPKALCICGAKVEAYTVAYSRELSREYGSETADGWVEVNHLHLLDEIHHVPLQLQLYSTFALGILARIGILFTTYLFQLALQVIFARACYRMVNEAFNERSFTQKLSLCARLAYWISVKFQPYRQSRLQLRQRLTTARPPWGWLYLPLCF